MLEKVKMALRITTSAFDDELNSLIEAAKLDLGIAGVAIIGGADVLVERAIITYCRVHFGNLDDGEWDRMKRSYDEQKAQLMTATGYTIWSSGKAGAFHGPC